MSGVASDIAIAFAAGAAFAAFYLGLIWTGARALSGPRPALRFGLLAAGRLVLVLTVLGGAFALGAGAKAVAAGLTGFVCVRLVATRRASAGEQGKGWAWK